MADQEQKTTDFGYETVSFGEKTQKVAEVFHSVASKYDVMNDFMSFGLHRLWKRFAIGLCDIRQNQKILDLAGGTGDLAKKFSQLVGAKGLVVLSDINASMLAVGREKMLNQGVTENLVYAQANAECLPFQENSFDCVTIAFGLRNVTDKEKALRAMLRVLKPGGRLMILEFSKPISPLRPIYDAYSFSILPVLGKLIAKDSKSYQYLAESIRMHPDQATLLNMLKTVGFVNCDYHNLTAGIVAIHRGFKA